MTKITIIGLGLVGNSLGMALKRAGSQGQNQSQRQGQAQAAQQFQVVGFDPDRERETLALRRHFSVDEIAPNLETAVRGASLVIVATPAEAAREVLEAIAPFLEEGTVVTDVLSSKGPVMAWAGEMVGRGADFVGGHPFSTTLDIDTASPDTVPSA